MDYFEPFADEDGRGRAAPPGWSTRFLVVSFDTDWRFPTAHSAEIARVLRRAGCAVVQEEVVSPVGARLVLLDVPRYHALVATFLTRGAGSSRPGPDAGIPAASCRRTRLYF